MEEFEDDSLFVVFNLFGSGLIFYNVKVKERTKMYNFSIIVHKWNDIKGSK